MVERSSSDCALLCEQYVSSFNIDVMINDCRTDGQQVTVKCNAAVYAHPPEEGAVITVTYYGHWDSKKLKYPLSPFKFRVF